MFLGCFVVEVGATGAIVVSTGSWETKGARVDVLESSTLGVGVVLLGVTALPVVVLVDS